MINKLKIKIAEGEKHLQTLKKKQVNLDLQIKALEDKIEGQKLHLQILERKEKKNGQQQTTAESTC